MRRARGDQARWSWWRAVVVVARRSRRSAAAPSGYRVQALFDNAGFAVPGEQVRIAGAPVGTISAAVGDQAEPRRGDALDLQPRLRPVVRQRHLHDPAAVADRRALRRLHARARRASGACGASPAATGTGSYLLPVTQTSSPIDPDIVQDISQDSVRESLSVILNELGTGLAGARIGPQRGDPARRPGARADRARLQPAGVAEQGAGQARHRLRHGAGAARQGPQLTGGLRRAGQHDRDRQRQQSARSWPQSIKLLPPFLQQLKPLMADLGQLASQGTPVVKDAGSSAAALDTEFKTLVPFANAQRRRSRTSATPPSSPRARWSVRRAWPSSWRTSAPPPSRRRRRCRSCSRASTRPAASSS